MSEPSKDLVPAPQPNGMIEANSVQAALAQFGGDESPIYCSFDLKTPEGKELFFRAAQAPAENLANLHNQVIDLVHVFATYAEKTDAKTGELVPMTRIVLVNDKAELFQCYSKGVKKALRLLFTSYGLPPYRTPIRVKVNSARLGNGNNWLTLEPAGEPAPKGAKR